MFLRYFVRLLLQLIETLTMRIAIKALFLSLCVCMAVAQQSAKTQSDQPRRDFGRGQFRGVVGTITEISGTTLKIKLQDGSIGTVTTNSNTSFRKDQQEAKLSDFKVGDSIFVRGDSSGDKTWTARMVGATPTAAQMQEIQQRLQERMNEAMGKTLVIGDVKSVDPPKLNIHRTDGVDQTIEADESTSFRKGREESITLPDIKVGDTIMARGELKDGVFVPSTINVLDPETAQRVKEGRGGLFFGFAGMGDARRDGQRSGQSQSEAQQPPK
jgi:Cu/Ag efflux protein CusF